MKQYELVPSSPSSAGEMNDFVFLSESEPLETMASSANTDPDVWRVLAVDDDPDFQRSMAFALSGMCVLGTKIALLQPGSHIIKCARDIGYLSGPGDGYALVEFPLRHLARSG